MAKTYIYDATVSGRMSFPIDMLRYDCCFPTTEADAGYITRSLTGRWYSGSESTTETINLTRVSSRRLVGEAFTGARWASFGWKVNGNAARLTVVD